MTDYAEMDDCALGDAVAEKVLGFERFAMGFLAPGPDGTQLIIEGSSVLSWWGAGLVIDAMRAAGYVWNINDDYTGAEDIRTIVEVGPVSDMEVSTGDAEDESPIRAILIAALKAYEAAT